MASPRSEILAWNERVKAIAGLAFNLGGGLAAGAAAKIYTDKTVVPEMLVWFAGIGGLLFVGWKVLHYIEGET